LTPTGDGFDVRSLAVTFRAGARLGEHRHPWGQLVFACSGVMRVCTSSDTWLTPATRAIWLPPGVVHRIEIVGEVAMRTLYIAPERAAPISDAPTTLEVEPLLREVILHVARIGMLAPDRPAHDRLAGVLIDLIGQARREDLRLPIPTDPRARSLALHLQSAPERLVGLSQLAQSSGASLRTLQRIFPRETGLTLEAWRQKARLINSVACLASALDSGYRNVGAFIDAFSRQFGVTPGRYGATCRTAGAAAHTARG
jgi:AraC-like DNA-binding protein/quercetin dioxygenase-like cupin family protein